MGMQFFDVAVYAIGAGGICLTVYRGLRGESIGAIWTFDAIPQSNSAEIIFGTAVGALAGVVGIAFRRCEIEPTICATRKCVYLVYANDETRIISTCVTTQLPASFEGRDDLNIYFQF